LRLFRFAEHSSPLECFKGCGATFRTRVITTLLFREAEHASSPSELAYSTEGRASHTVSWWPVRWSAQKKTLRRQAKTCGLSLAKKSRANIARPRGCSCSANLRSKFWARRAYSPYGRVRARRANAEHPKVTLLRKVTGQAQRRRPAEHGNFCV
jgi:hypothetical protein